MHIFDFFPGQGNPITQYGSESAAIQPVALLGDTTSLVCIQLDPGGVLGNHPASEDQLFFVINGHGEISGDAAGFKPIKAGQCALWHKGEYHTTRSAHGLTALVVEGKLQKLKGLENE
jgi:mannose-6-phosphate isomerase-like protein (cupin superfamily)